jgi:hypothetical protein
VGERPVLDFPSGYVKRSIDEFPRGSRKPWRLYQNYLLDLLTLKYGAVDDAAMEFSKPAPRVVEQPSLRSRRVGQFGRTAELRYSFGDVDRVRA